MMETFRIVSNCEGVVEERDGVQVVVFNGEEVGGKAFGLTMGNGGREQDGGQGRGCGVEEGEEEIGGTTESLP